MKIVLLTQEQFDRVRDKIHPARMIVANLPTPSIILPLQDTVLIVGSNVSIHTCENISPEYQNGMPFTLTQIAHSTHDPKSTLKEAGSGR